MKRFLISLAVGIVATASQATIIEGTFTGTVAESYDTTNYFGDELADNALAGSQVTGTFYIDTESAALGYGGEYPRSYFYEYEGDGTDFVSFSLITSSGTSFNSESDYWNALPETWVQRELFRFEDCYEESCSNAADTTISDYFLLSQTGGAYWPVEIDLDGDGSSDYRYSSTYSLGLYSDSPETLFDGSDGGFPNSLEYLGEEVIRNYGWVEELLLDLDGSVVFEYGFNYTIDSLTWKVVPEPGSVTLLGLGISLLVASRRKKLN